ncbi:MAG: phospho-sugar mutase [Rothia sp. (in: high G+C Gram-positive bacteria)]|uniref:phospho-sugar mutase n=1 Tax=Rothia sp. (in: high G+C Gram-positive bacteria) TaxID=1885016 RepID=UPI0026FD9281|nr:phospho-sugar mutase [Rothia sp. (in: high G+C Gram-positive bacteria)]
MSLDTQQLLEQARIWAAIDPDTETKAQLEGIIAQVEAGDAAATANLADRFSGTLQFGTAGLRAELGAGPMRMNRVVVQRAAQGLADYATARASAEGWEKISAVVGFDARKNSDIFALDTAAIFTAAGIEVHLMPSALPTPVTAWATREYGAEIGVMVTASHNPPNDNGYKVYLGGAAVEPGARGAQIIPPYDGDIAAAIAAVDTPVLAADGWKVLPESVAADYIARVTPLVEQKDRDLNIVLTPMHGVGGQTAEAVLRQAGFTNVTLVPEQAEPDPRFSTVAFPNPEEPGALDLAMALAEKIDADLIIANDPDADRAAFAVKRNGTWAMLRGDEAGAILATRVLASVSDPAKATFANSIVSSRLAGAIAKAAGVAHRETLTGFKWIARVENLTFGYEEALGYCVDHAQVRDKDGISAALVMADYAQELKDAGSSLPALLDEIATEHGLYATDQLSVRVDDLAQIPAMMQRLRATPPAELAESPVVSVEDLTEGTDTLPPTDGMRYYTEDSTRVIVRPSGTEPKLKCYLEVVVPVSTTVANARTVADTKLALLKADMSAALGL